MSNRQRPPPSVTRGNSRREAVAAPSRPGATSKISPGSTTLAHPSYTFSTTAKTPVYVFPEPALTPGASLPDGTGLIPDRIIDLGANNAGNILGAAGGAGNIEAMAWSEPEDAMYWFGPRVFGFGAGDNDNDTDRDVYRIPNWSTLAAGNAPAATYVGPIVFRPVGSSPSPNAAGAADISPDGNVIAIAQWSAGATYAMFHVKADGDTWENRLTVKKQPDLSDSIDVARPNEGIAFAPDMSTLFIHQEGNAGSSAAKIYCYDLTYIPSSATDDVHVTTGTIAVTGRAVTVDVSPDQDIQLAAGQIFLVGRPVAVPITAFFAADATVAGVSLVILRGSLNIEDRVEEVTTCSFDVWDETGTAEFHTWRTGRSTRHDRTFSVLRCRRRLRVRRSSVRRSWTPPPCRSGSTGIGSVSGISSPKHSSAIPRGHCPRDTCETSRR